MKLAADAFLRQLKHKTLAPFYWLSGDEPFQLQEVEEALHAEATHQGFSERLRFDAQGLDISMLQGAYYSASLLAEKRIIDLHLPQGKLPEALGEFLSGVMERKNPEVLLILVSPKLESSTSQTKLFKAFEVQGIVVQCWPISMEQFPGWLSGRLAKHHLSASLAGLKCLAELTEGNLVYATQSIEKLAMIYPAAKLPLTPEQITEAVAPQAYFETFQLNEAFLAGNKVRALTICRHLQASGVEVILVWGALLKDVRLLIKLSESGDRHFSEACQKLGIWEKRKPLYRQALQRGCKNVHMLKAMAQMDQYIKNHSLGDPWLALERFLLRF